MNSIDADDITDWASLIHYWDYNSTEFSLGNANYESGGWRNTHLYMDDFMGTAGVKVIDPEGASATAFTSVMVQNVNPLISIYDASVISNISFEVYRNSISKEGNFTFNLYTNEAKKLTNSLTFDGSSELSESSTTTQVDMTLCKDWKVVVNSTQLPSSSWFTYYIRLQFLDGQELVISSSKIYGDGSNYGYWERILNPYFYDNSEFSYKFPINLKTQIWDPSVDEINLSLSYMITMLLEINCTNSLPLDYSFEVEQILGTANYTVHVFEQDGKIYANITVVQDVIYSEIYEDNDFPVDLDKEFIIYPIIDLIDIFEDRGELTQFSIKNCLYADNFIIANITDDDNGFNTLTVVFNTEDNIEFQNLSPKIDGIIANNASTTREIKFYLQISDFDQASDSGEYYTSNFKDMYIPYQPSDFNLTYGALETDYGNLEYSDNDTSTLTSTDNSFVLPQPIDFEGIETAAEYYYGSAKFNKEEVGTSGTDIAWVDAVNLYDGEAIIVEEWQDHKNVLRLQDDETPGQDPYLGQRMSQATAGTVEFYLGTNDVTEKWVCGLYEIDTAFVGLLWIENSKIYYQDHLFALQEIQAIANDKWYHIKLVWRADSTWDIYIDGVKKVDNVSTTMDQVSGVDAFLFQGQGDSTDYIYLDAWGNIAQSGYFESYNINPHDIEPLLDEDYKLGCAFGGSHIKITSSVGGHEDVLEMYDNQNDIDYGDSLEIKFDFSGQDYGIIESFVRSSDSTYANNIKLFHEDTQLIYFSIYQDKFQYYDEGWHNISGAPTPQDDTWYNICIAFETTDSGYKDLAQYDWKVWINGIEYGDFDFENNYSLNNLHFSTGSADNGYTYYIDNVDFSSRYITIYDGTMEELGNLENIDDDYTTIKSSQLVDSIGHYKSTWFVKEDTNNEVPVGWTSLYAYDAVCSCYIIDEKDGHRKVLRCKDYSSSKDYAV